jgi:hypothetical protein
MSAKRMSREEFFAKLAPLEEDRLRKALWNLYWRGSAAIRERIEAEIGPVEEVRRKRAVAEPPDPDLVLADVQEFAELARAGAYIAGDRRVSPRERTRWRLTFRRLAADASSALRAEDSGPAETALEQLIDLACETHSYDYFRSEDPIEAARFVVSDAAALLWETVRDRHGFPVFAQRAAPQLLRWESPHGWTRSGWGPLREKETSLTSVLARMLRVPDMWTAFASRYLEALDAAIRADAVAPKRIWGPGIDERASRRRERARRLAKWHDLLISKLTGSEVENLLDKLVAHPALGGPELTFVQAKLAYQRGDPKGARPLVYDCLKDLPGHQGFLDFAADIGAPLPPRARDAANERARMEALITAQEPPGTSA